MSTFTPKALFAAAFSVLATSVSAQAILTAETGPPGTVPFTAMTALAEIAAGEGIAKGAGPYAKLGAEKGAELIDNVRVLHTYNYGGFGLYAYNSSSVKGWGDVAGKTILNGPPRGAALTNDRGILQLVSGVEDGKDYKGIQVNWGQMPKTITDGSADAMMLPVTFPDNRITRSLAAGDMTLWSIPKDIWEGERMQKYIKSPGTAAITFDLSDVAPQEGLTIVSEDGVWRSPSTVGSEVVHKDFDFDTAKALTAAVIANSDAFLSKTPFMATTNVGSVGLGMCGPVPVKYHPGAVAAYEEAGITVPDCAKPDA